MPNVRKCNFVSPASLGLKKPWKSAKYFKVGGCSWTYGFHLTLASKDLEKYPSDARTARTDARTDAMTVSFSQRPSTKLNKVLQKSCMKLPLHSYILRRTFLWDTVYASDGRFSSCFLNIQSDNGGSAQ